MREFVSYVDAIGSDFQHENNTYLNSFINACNVVGISCTESSQTLSEKGFETFDVAIIDEVSKATPPELLIPLLLAEKAILVGDHRQLPPLFGEHLSTYSEYQQDALDSDPESASLLSDENFYRFESLVTNSLFKRHYEQADLKNKGALLTQYRMHREIMDVVNMFYDGKLESGWSQEEESRIKGHHAYVYSHRGTTPLISPEHHAYWIDSSELHGHPFFEVQDRSSKHNPLEAFLIAKIVKQIDDSYSSTECSAPVEIGIISFYMSQVRRIETELKKYHLKSVRCEVKTVDRFQGKEKEIIILSLVRHPQGRYDATYVKAYQRINVAVSRAQNLLLVVGAKDMYMKQNIDIEDMETGRIIKSSPVYAEIINTLSRRGCLLHADDIIAPDEIIPSFTQLRGE